ncbi:MAG TPA: tetratricopeptide repeat protein [Ignavibacteria bacterium]|nr:tetratricopeptide repeat protein [Ignavibacteria bacterium]
MSNGAVLDSTSDDPEPNYDISLDNNYQDFTSYLYPGNRVENFTAYFNTHFRAEEDYDEAMAEYKTSLISIYSRQLDSLGVELPVSGNIKDKLNKSIERASKIIQFHKNSKYIDNAVLLIGKSYYYLQDYFNAERKFDEFISKLSSSENADEAILFLGRTKFRLGKKDEGRTILQSLLKSTDDNEIKSLTIRDLGILEYNSGNVSQSVSDFKASIDYSNDNERKAESQYILANIISIYKPEESAKEYQKVLEYTSDFDLTFFANLNTAKGLIYNKNFSNADEILTTLRKKYRDFPAYTQLVDLEIANNLYAQNKIFEADQKYYDVIVRYPGSVSSSDAYYYLAKHDEDVDKDYYNALLNYKKSVEENPTSNYHKESTEKVTTLERYFSLLGSADDSVKVIIPTVNSEVEKYRRNYNLEKGIEQPPENNGEQNKGTPPSDPNTNPGGPGGPDDGSGKGRPGGFSNMYFKALSDSLEIPEVQTDEGNSNENYEGQDQNIKNKENTEIKETDVSKEPVVTDTLTKKEEVKTVNSDSIKAVADSIEAVTKEDKKFNSYYEIAEIFIYNLPQKDSAEHYLKLLLKKFPDPAKQAKVLYTLGNFYKNNDNIAASDEIFNKIISDYPSSIYAFESKKIMGIIPNKADVIQNPIEESFTKAITLYNDKKYEEAIAALHEIESKYPNDTLLAKAYYGLGFVYENNLLKKDSSIFYYKKLKDKFPNSEYATKVSPLLEYVESMEVKDSSAVSDSSKSAVSDSTQVTSDGNDSLKTEVAKEQPKDENPKENPKEENTEEVTPDTNNVGTENNLSQEEIERLLKETEIPPDK